MLMPLVLEWDVQQTAIGVMVRCPHTLSHRVLQKEVAVLLKYEWETEMRMNTSLDNILLKNTFCDIRAGGYELFMVFLS